MKKIFTLLTLLIAIAGSSKAQSNVFCETFTGYNATTAATDYNGWSLTYFSTSSFYTSTQSSGPSGPNSYKFGVDSATAISPNITGADHINFWMKGNATTGGTLANGAFYIYETSDGVNYTLIDMVNPISTTGQAKQYAITAGTTNIKFFYDKDSGNVAFDDFCATIGAVGFVDATKNVVFSAYPNPSRGMLNVNLSTPRNSIVTISNMIGAEIRRFAMKSNELSTVLDLTDLQDGIYFIKVKTDIGESTERIVLRK